MKAATIPIESILVEDRMREDLGNIAALADSIEEVGLIQPIVLSPENRLLAGGRRLAAMTSLEWKEVPFVYLDELTEDQQLEVELAENQNRKDMTWQESVKAINRIHNLKSQLKAKNSESWGMRQTGDLLGLALGKVQYCTHLAKLILAGNQDIIDCVTMADALKLLLRRKEEAAAKQALDFTKPDSAAMIADLVDDAEEPAAFTADSTEDGALPVIRLGRMLLPGDCLDHMAAMKPGMVDAIVTDPPFGIDMKNLQQTGTGMDVELVAKEHDVEENVALLEAFLPAAYRVLSDNGFMVMWYDMDHHAKLQQWASEAGFKVQRWPFVWEKTHSCMNQAAQYNFTKSVEFAMILRKAGATLVAPESTCHMAASVTETKAMLGDHPFIKPLPIWKRLISAVAIPPQTIYDPFAGYGSSTVTAILEGYKVLASELNDGHYLMLKENVKEAIEETYGDVEFKD